MKDLTLFILAGCPHCRLALKYQEELMEENPAYRAIPITTIDEGEQSALADTYDYYYVPTYFAGREKLFEGHMEKSDVEAVLKAALEG